MRGRAEAIIDAGILPELPKNWKLSDGGGCLIGHLTIFKGMATTMEQARMFNSMLTTFRAYNTTLTKLCFLGGDALLQTIDRIIAGLEEVEVKKDQTELIGELVEV